MEYSELQGKTWIYIDNKYHFVEWVNDGFVLLAYSSTEYKMTPKTLFPIHAKPVEPNKYNVNETVLYLGKHEKAHNKTGLIKLVAKDASYSQYRIHVGNEMIWASPFDLAPVNY